MADDSSPSKTGVPDDMVALDEAIKKAEGVGALAKLIGVTTSAPSMWRARGSVPAEHCPAIERETGIPCERLNPKVDWATVRNGSAQLTSTDEEAGPSDPQEHDSARA